MIKTIRPKWNSEDLPEAVKRYNALVSGLALAVPEVSALLDGARITGNMVDKKTRTAIDAVCKKYMPADIWARCYLDTQYTYTLYLKADFNAPCSPHGCAYFGASVMVAKKEETAWKGASGDVPGLMSLDDVNAKIAEATRLEDVAYQAVCVASEAKRECLEFVV